MAVPYIFQTQTGAIPLSQLDSNFSTTITIGSTALYLGDTLTNIVGATVGGLSFTTAGGTGNIGLGSVLTSISTGGKNIAIGNGSLAALVTGARNTVVGYGSAGSTTGSDNTVIGDESLSSGTSSGFNTVVGSNSMLAYTASTGYNTAIGYSTLSAATTGQKNVSLGWSSGSAITTGSSNVILGSYNGNSSSLDIRTKSNYVVVADGDGTPKIVADGSGKFGYGPGYVASVTQTTNRTTSVTNNTPCGSVLLFTAAPTLNSWVTFRVNNTAVRTNDIVAVSFASSTNTYIACVSKVQTGYFDVSFSSISGVASDSPYLAFAVIGASYA